MSHKSLKLILGYSLATFIVVVIFISVYGEGKEYKCTVEQFELVNREIQICKYSDSFCSMDKVKKTYCSESK